MWRAREVYGLCVPYIYIETAQKTSHVFPVHGIRNVQTELKRGVETAKFELLLKIALSHAHALKIIIVVMDIECT